MGQMTPRRVEYSELFLSSRYGREVNSRLKDPVSKRALAEVCGLAALAVHSDLCNAMLVTCTLVVHHARLKHALPEDFELRRGQAQRSGPCVQVKLGQLASGAV